MLDRDAHRLRHRPVIGVIACGRVVEGEPAQAVKHRYLEAVERFAEAVPLIVPTNQAIEHATDIVARLDAILLTALGGTLRDLRQSIGPDAHHAPAEASLEDAFAFTHPVDIIPSSMLHRMVEASRMSVNSVHFQAIDRLADPLVANATGPHEVIEAVSATGTPAPVFAVQWHPEWRPENRPHDLAFWHYLGEAARSSYMPAPGAETAA